MLQLLINDKPVDLQGDEEIAVDYAMFDIKDIGSRKGARSYNFTLPLTANNKRVFETSDVLNSLNRLPYSKLKARALVNGIDVGIRFAELESVSDVFSVRLYGSNSGFYNLIYDKTLAQLDVSDLDHMWDWENVVNKRSNTAGIVYPIIDYSSESSVVSFDDVNNKVFADKLLPAFFVHDLLKRIVESVGYEYQDYLEQELLALGYHLILPSSGYGLDRDGRANLYTGKWTISNTYALPAIAGQNGAIHFDAMEGVISSYYSNLIQHYGDTGFPILFPQAGIYSITITLNLFNTSGSNVNLQPYLLNGTEGSFADWFSLGTIVVPYTGTNPATDAPFVATITTPTTGGYQILPVIQMPNSVFSNQQILWGKGSSIEITDFVNAENADNSLQYNSNMGFVEAQRLLPNMKMTDFVKTYCQMFGLFINVDEDTQKVTFSKFNDVLQSTIWRALDWSEKIDNTTLPLQQFILSEYAQTNNFIYKEVEDETAPQGTNAALVIDNKNLELERNYLQLPFGYTNTSNHLNRNVPNIKVIKAGGLFNTSVPRILLMQHQSSLNPVVYTDGDADTTDLAAYYNLPFCWFIQDDKTINLGFASNLLPRYYSNLQQIISNLKIIKLPLRLTAADINQLDFTRPVYLSQFSSYFYINKIQGFKYTSNDSTMVELVKLNIHG